MTTNVLDFLRWTSVWVIISMKLLLMFWKMQHNRLLSKICILAKHQIHNSLATFLNTLCFKKSCFLSFAWKSIHTSNEKVSICYQLNTMLNYSQNWCSVFLISLFFWSTLMIFLSLYELDKNKAMWILVKITIILFIT
jgi:hypothetical protein